MPLNEDEYTEAHMLYGAARQEWARVIRTDSYDDKLMGATTEEIAQQYYWQGQKDMARKLLAILAPDADERQRWDSLQRSSDMGFQSRLELLTSQICEARKIIQDKPGQVTGNEWIKWVDRTKTCLAPEPT